MSKQQEKIRQARNFLWEDEEEAQDQNQGGVTNLSGARLAGRDVAVDQSINLHDMNSGGTNLMGGPADIPLDDYFDEETGARRGIMQSVAGLFRSKPTTKALNDPYDPYGNAMPAMDSDEHIGKSRRSPHFLVAMKNAMYSCRYRCGRLKCNQVCVLVSVIVILLGVASLAIFGNPYVSIGSPKQNSYDQAKEFLVSNAVSEEDVFSGVMSSPQKKALNWIVYDDEAQLTVKDKGFQERYILAVLHYSMNKNKDSWTDKVGWITSEGICQWEGIECVPRAQKGTDFVARKYDDNDAITSIVLNDNDMEGIVPPELAALEECITLDLSKNALTGSLPKVTETMKALRNLLLRDNSFSGSIPGDYSQISNLHELHLANNELTGSIPTTMASLTELKNLAVSGNQLTGKVQDMPFKGMGNSLETLYLDRNKFGGTIPQWIESMGQLRELRMDNLNLGGSIPREMKGLKKIELLRLDHNYLTGSVPNIWDHTPALVEIQLNHNSLTGVIPQKLDHPRNLAMLHLQKNKFSGGLPHNIGTMSNLKELILNDNKLAGTISTWIGDLQSVEKVSLNFNQFNGTIPTELGGCAALQELHLQDNALTGSIPKQLSSLNHLVELRLEENKLEGITMPDGICAKVDQSKISHLSADCRSKVTCACCHECS